MYDMKQIRTIAVVVTALAAAGVVAYAAIPDSNGVIHGCYNLTAGTLRVIDSAVNQGCKQGETALNWSQVGPRGATGPRGGTGATGATGTTGARGAQGPAGPAGGALAWANVNADGTIATGSGNITVQKGGAGSYCIGVTGGTPHVAIANLDSLRNIGGSVQTGVFQASACSAFSSAKQIYVVTRPHGQDGGFPGADRGFYIMVN